MSQRDMRYREWLVWFASKLEKGEADIQTDNQGQLVIYTGDFLWNDNTVRGTPDPEWEDV